MVYRFLKWFQHIGCLKPCVAIDDPQVGSVSQPDLQSLVHCLDKYVNFHHTVLHTLHVLVYTLKMIDDPAKKASLEGDSPREYSWEIC